MQEPTNTLRGQARSGAMGDEERPRCIFLGPGRSSPSVSVGVVVAVRSGLVVPIGRCNGVWSELLQSACIRALILEGRGVGGMRRTLGSERPVRAVGYRRAGQNGAWGELLSL